MNSNLDHTTPEGREQMRQAANKRTKNLELQKAKIIAEIIEISMVKFILDEIYREKLSGLLENNNSKENV